MFWFWNQVLIMKLHFNFTSLEYLNHISKLPTSKRFYIFLHLKIVKTFLNHSHLTIYNTKFMPSARPSLYQVLNLVLVPRQVWNLFQTSPTPSSVYTLVPTLSKSIYPSSIQSGDLFSAPSLATIVTLGSIPPTPLCCGQDWP